MEHLLNVFLKTFYVLFDLVEKDKKFTASQNASYRILWRIFRISRCMFNSSLEGYYDVSIALMRIAFENHILLAYLSENEEEAKLWFKGKTFHPSFLRRKYLSKNNEKDDKWKNSMYRGMSEFIHSSFKSTLVFTQVEKGEERGVLGEYDKAQFENAIKTTIFMLWATTVLSFFIFPEVVENEEWHSFSWDGFIEITKYIGQDMS